MGAPDPWPRSPVPKSEGPGAPSSGLERVTGTGATRQGRFVATRRSRGRLVPSHPFHDKTVKWMGHTRLWVGVNTPGKAGGLIM